MYISGRTHVCIFNSSFALIFGNFVSSMEMWRNKRTCVLLTEAGMHSKLEAGMIYAEGLNYW